MAKKKIRVGFIGAGGIAGSHIKNLLPIDGVEIVALSDIKQEPMDAVIKANDLQDVECFTDYKKMLKTVDLDAVSVCTPNFLHKEPTVAAVKAGCHVMVEKPLAMNAKEGQAMVDAAKKAKKVLSIGFQHRFRPGAAFIRHAIDEKQLGDVLYCRAQALRRRGIPSWGVFGRKDLQGGGPLIDIGVHILEVCHFMLGKPKPVAASAVCHTYLGDKKPKAYAPWGDWDYKTYTVEDLACGFVRFENGLSLSVECSFAAHIENDVFAATFMGTDGGATWEGASGRVFTDWCGKMVNIEPKVMEPDNSFAVKMQGWIDAIRGGDNPCPGEDGLAVQKILDALYASAEKGKEVTIK